jgi:hypothetical protein
MKGVGLKVWDSGFLWAHNLKCTTPGGKKPRAKRKQIAHGRQTLSVSNLGTLHTQEGRLVESESNTLGCA